MRKSDDAAVSSADDALEAKDFSKFFTDKIRQIRKETDGAPETEYNNNNNLYSSNSADRMTIDQKYTKRNNNNERKKYRDIYIYIYIYIYMYYASK